MRLITAVLFLLATANGILAQTAGVKSPPVGQDARIQGTVTDGSGAVMPGAKVTAIRVDGQAYETTSDQTGRFDLAVAQGIYRVEFTGDGFGTFKLLNYPVPNKSLEPLIVILPVSEPADYDLISEVTPIEDFGTLSVSSEIYTHLPGRKTTSRAWLTGTVYDPAGAVIPGATVTAVDGENRIFKSKTNEFGVYELELPFALYDSSSKGTDMYNFKIAKYDISAEAPHFIKTVVSGFKLVPSYRRQMKLDFALDIIGPDPCHDPTACSKAVPVQNEKLVPDSNLILQKPSSPKKTP